MARHGVTFVFLMATLCSPISGVFAAPYTPPADDAVLEQLPLGLSQTRLTIKSLQAAHNADPSNIDRATELAEFYIKLGRTEADPRDYAYADGALSAWIHAENPPEKILRLRAMIRQFRHDFSGSLKDLDQLLARAPDDTQGWITKATVLRLSARYHEAAEACIHLKSLNDSLIALTCLTDIASLAGDPDAYSLLSRAAQAQGGANRWTLTVLAEMADRLGKGDEADLAFHKALALAPDDPYLLGTYADFLLANARAAEVLPLLKGRTRIDSLVLRLALGQDATAPGSAAGLIPDIADRFDAMRRRGETPHLGDEARFHLILLHQPDQAYDLAVHNWELMREPRDSRILAQSALATGNAQKAAHALELLQEGTATDHTLAAFTAELARR